jgi:putative transposase
MNLAEDYRISQVCRVLALPRSSYYYRVQADTTELTEIKAALQRLAAQWPTYGYRRLTAHLHREGYRVNSKRVRGLMSQFGLTKHSKPRVVHTTNSQHGFGRYPNLVEHLVVERSDQVWVADVTYIRLQREFVYLAVLMDVFTRSIRGWHLGRSLEQELTLIALQRAFAAGCPEIHHSDQGVQYAATAYVTMLHEADVAISMAEVGEPTQNGYAERLMRTIKEEHVDLTEYVDYHDAYQQIGRFLDEVYMHKRIHSSLGYLTPAEFEGQWRAQQQVAEVTHFYQ